MLALTMRSIFLLIFISLLCANHAQAHDLLCRHWLGGKYVGDKPAFESDVHVDGIMRETSIDYVGVKGQCRDKFPSWGERMKIERVGTDPFEVKYHMVRQYCWARWIFDSEQRCGGPKIEWCFIVPCGFRWDPPNYTCWGDTKTKIADAGFMDGDIFTLWHFSKVSLRRIAPGGEIPSGDSGNVIKNATKKNKICAYYETNVVGGLFTQDGALIGCVDEPLKPRPPTFNQVVPPSREPYVEQGMPISDLVVRYGSRFDQPVALVTIPSPTKHLVLRYKFPGDNTNYDATIPYASAPACGKFDDYPLEYCVKVNPSLPSEVCICQGGINGDDCTNNTFLGCVARPIPDAQEINIGTKIKIIGSYTVASKLTGEPCPGIALMFIRTDLKGDPILIDAEGSNVYAKSNGKYYKKDQSGYETNVPAIEPINYKKLPLPADPQVIREYVREFMQTTDSSGTTSDGYMVSRDAAESYGLNFLSAIPKIEQNKVKSIYVYKAQEQWSQDGCVATTTISDAAAVDGSGNPMYLSYFVPTGKRIRDECCSSSVPDDIDEEMKSCVVPRYRGKCKDGSNAPPKDDIAEQAVCPGSYEGPLTNTDGSLVNPTQPDKICLVNNSSWHEAMPQPYCVEMPMPCSAVDIPTEASGYALWDKGLNDGNMQSGVCDIAFGFDYKRDISVELSSSVASLADDDPQKISALIALDKAKNDLARLQEIAAKENRNVRIAEMQIAKRQQINQGSFSKDGIVISRSAPLIPIRRCIANIYGSAVQNPCVKADSCVAITKASPSNSNVTLTSAADRYKSAAMMNASVADGIFEDKAEVLGSCSAPYHQEQTDSTPTRKCLTSYETYNKGVYLLRQIWSDEIQNRCVK